MMNETKFIDLSGFFLFEATGDSSEIPTPAEQPPAAAEDDDDDAQSCSGRSLKRVLSFEENDEDENEDSISSDNVMDYEDEDDDEDGDEVNQRWIMRDKKLLMRQQSQIRKLGVVRTNRGFKPPKRSSKVCNLEIMSERDKDKLFWEACLSS